ncbi:hypothetical protein L210DRAFT_3654828 [Boletus edulis BED1]|uniref:Uncharacterized protein n=1 Tax=Boletus edulis BED1 TaxID=1328754 RepID=A0AAD4G6X6_BOLED|nr:hypothetical protein L210DRAFT_3654828 [Boletus edulis BED1]
MTPLDSPVSPSWQPEEHYAGMIPYPPLVSQVDFDPAGAQDHYSAFPESNSSLDSNDSDAMFTPIDVTQGHIPWISSGPEYGIGPALTENPSMNNALQASDEVVWYSVSSAFGSLHIPCTTSPILQASSLVEDIEESLPTTAHPLSYPHTVVDIPPTGWATGHPEAGFLPGHPSTFNFVDPPFRIDGSSFPGENVQMVGPEAVQSPLYTSTLTLEELGWLCGWKNEDGTLCDEIFTRASLPMHLAKHGIKNKSRTSPTKCRWLGCKARKPMNRESIVRHIREVHMHLRRLSKG